VKSFLNMKVCLDWLSDIFIGSAYNTRVSVHK